MKRHRLKKEWETYIQDYKIADYQRFHGVKTEPTGSSAILLATQIII